MIKKMDSTHHLIILIILFFGSHTLISAHPCSTLDGVWYNELGSMMTLAHSSDGALAGTYLTAVEREDGAAGPDPSQVNGLSPYNEPGAVFGFSVMWKNGESLTSWTGQCLVCDDGVEILETSWILKMKVNSCGDIWQSTLIGQNIFAKNESYVKHTRRRKREATQFRFKRETEGNLTVTGKAFTAPCSSITGAWYNQLGSEMIIHTHQDNDVRGEYRRSLGRCGVNDGAAGASHSEVYGVSNIADTSSTLSLYVLWNNGESITGWAGQCHVCNQNGEETLVMTWLLRSKVNSCDDDWAATNYGEAIFSRHRPTGSGPYTHTPREAGEVSPRAADRCSGAALVHQGILMWLTCLFCFVCFL